MWSDECIYMAADLDNFTETVRRLGWNEYHPNDITGHLTSMIDLAISDLGASLVAGYNPRRGTEQFVLQFDPGLQEKAEKFATELQHWVRTEGATISIVLTREPYVHFRVSRRRDGDESATGYEELECWRQLKKLKRRGKDAIWNLL